MNMKFSDMLKKNKKEQTEEISNPEVQHPDDLLEEMELVNEARVNMKNDDEDGDALPEISAEDTGSAEDRLKAEAAEWNNKYLRLYAEFDNYKRRTTKERLELFQTAGKDVILSLLPVLDDFERALRSIENAAEVDSVKEGIILVQQKLKNILAAKGLKEMEAKGVVFDPDLHEAITNIPAPADDLKGKNIDELEKGYYLNDKVIRFAKVVVGA